jgi:FkbM family methyltransferase
MRLPHMIKTAALWAGRGFAALMARLPTADRETIARLIWGGASRGQADALEIFGRAMVNLSVAGINDLTVNGELALLQRTSFLDFRVLFDVGANVGKWSEAALTAHPHATIHAFEIVPSTFRTLSANLVPQAGRVVANDFGLADTDGEVMVHVGPDPIISSIYDFGKPQAGTKRVPCRVRRGDHYASEQGISQIDFVKIDAEGADFLVVRGLEVLLATQSIRLLQFEYNYGAIVSHFLLYDFYKLLTAYGYELGRLTPHGVVFRDYEFAYEDFNGPNYVACRKGDDALKAAIAAPRGAG